MNKGNFLNNYGSTLVIYSESSWVTLCTASIFVSSHHGKA